MSTASNKDDLDNRLKDLGGRRGSTNRALVPPEREPPPPILQPTQPVPTKDVSTGKRRPSTTEPPVLQNPSLGDRSSTSGGSSRSSSRDSSRHDRKKKARRSKHRRRKSSSPNDSSSRSDRSLLPKGLSHAKYHRPRAAVREWSRDPARSSSQRGKYDAIVDRLTAVAEKEGRKSGVAPKIDQFTVCALRGFGCHKVELCTGTYGSDLETAMRRVSRTDRDHLWHCKLEIPLTNRIARAASTGRFGNIVGDGADEISLTLSDCFALDMVRYKAFKRDGEKVENPGKEPHTLACCKSSAKQEIILYCLLFGREHEKERKTALKRLVGFHEKRPELFTVNYLVE